ncbi:MAG: PepSY domain-containing protein [Oleispira sp.]|nr:PepSY domain-containing protein [Oleispira sp.]
MSHKKSFISSNTVKSSLKSHSYIALWFSALLYLICLSGSVAVFFEEFERLEQPKISEYSNFPAEHMQPAMDEYVQRIGKTPKFTYIVLPTDDFPRTHITNGIDEWYLNQDGSFSDPVASHWTGMLQDLHTNLHLPHIIGSTLVGFFGIVLFSLIISGIFAHPKLFKDVFLLRRTRSDRLNNTDWHNRLSVWGLPFHLMMAITGAFIGLSSLLIFVTALSFFNNDTQAVVDAIYGEKPVLEGTGGNINYPEVFRRFKIQAPLAKPIYLVVHNMGNKEQLIEIAATLPNRLIYSEMYQFNEEGNFIDKQGISDGPAGRQMSYSTYRLHFGHFDSFWVKPFYFLMGLMLSLMAVFGMNIWFARRDHRSWINHAWQGWVWGVPSALMISAITSLISINPYVVFYLSLALILIFNILYGERFNCLKIMRYLLISLIPILVIMYLGIKLL